MTDLENFDAWPPAQRSGDVDPVLRDDELLTALGTDHADAVRDALTWDDDPLEPAGPAGAPDEPVTRRPAARSADPVAHLLAALRADISIDLPDDAFSIDSVAGVTGRTGTPSVARVVTLSDARRRRRVAPRAVAAAAVTVAVVMAGGFSAAAASAGPGSWLYPLRQALTRTPSAPSASQSAAREVDADLDTADRALDGDRLPAARSAVAAARLALPLVDPHDGRAALARRLTATATRIADIGAAEQPAGADGTAPAPNDQGGTSAPGDAARGRHGGASGNAGGRTGTRGHSAAHRTGAPGHSAGAHRGGSTAHAGSAAQHRTGAGHGNGSGHHTGSGQSGSAGTGQSAGNSRGGGHGNGGGHPSGGGHSNGNGNGNGGQGNGGGNRPGSDVTAAPGHGHGGG